MTVHLTSSRRMFLRGAAGASLAIPFLPSILQNKAQAATTEPRCFVSFHTEHGGAPRHDFFPPDEHAVQRTALGGLWDAHHGPLQRSEAGGTAFVSPILSGPSDLLTERLVGKMNTLLGLDYTIYGGHNTAYALGAYATGKRTYNSRDSWGPSIDQLIANASSFYPQRADGAGPEIAAPVVHTHPTVKHVRPSDRTSPLLIENGESLSGLWSALFEPSGPVRDGDPVEENERRVRVLNRTHEAYARLQSRASSSGGRLSELDRQRLDRHMDTLSGLRRRFDAALGCTSAHDGALSHAEITRAAIECGMSRVFSFSALNFGFVPQEARDTFNDIHTMAHAASAGGKAFDEFGADRVAKAVEWWRTIYQQVFERMVLPMAAALDFEDAEGRNVLDHSLLLWASESGHVTHHPDSIPVVTFGGLGGALNTGHFIDYRGPRPFHAGKPEHRKGLAYDQLLGTFLRGFDVPLEDYDRYRARPAAARGLVEGRPRVGGYGAYSVGQTASGSWYHEEDILGYADTPLPVLWNG